MREVMRRLSVLEVEVQGKLNEAFRKVLEGEETTVPNTVKALMDNPVFGEVDWFLLAYHKLGGAVGIGKVLGKSDQTIRNYIKIGLDHKLTQDDWRKIARASGIPVGALTLQLDRQAEMKQPEAEDAAAKTVSKPKSVAKKRLKK